LHSRARRGRGAVWVLAPVVIVVAAGLWAWRSCDSKSPPPSEAVEVVPGRSADRDAGDAELRQAPTSVRAIAPDVAVDEEWDGPRTAGEFLAQWPNGAEIAAKLKEMGGDLDAEPPLPMDVAKAEIRQLLLPDRSRETVQDAPAHLFWPAEIDNAWVLAQLGVRKELDAQQLFELQAEGDAESQAIWRESYQPYRRGLDEAFARELDLGRGEFQPFLTQGSNGPTNYFASAGIALGGWGFSVGLDKDEYGYLAEMRNDISRRVGARDRRLRALIKSWQ